MGPITHTVSRTVNNKVNKKVSKEVSRIVSKDVSKDDSHKVSHKVSQENRRKKFSLVLRSLKPLGLALLFSTSMPVLAWEAELRVNGELIPAEVVQGFQIHQSTTETNCPPHSTIRERDRLVAAFARVKIAEERGLTMTKGTKAELARRQIELDSDRAKTDESHRNKFHWLLLSSKSTGYWSNTIGKVDDEEVEWEYNRLVKAEDPRFVDVPLFKVASMTSGDEQYLQKIADRLRSGETWRQVSADIDPYDWNSHNKDKWTVASRMSGARSKAYRALNIDPRELERSDVIGPIPEYGHFNLNVILAKTTEKQIPIDAEIMNSNKWAYGEIRGDIYTERHMILNKHLLKNIEVTENGKPITIAFEHPPCPI